MRRIALLVCALVATLGLVPAVADATQLVAMYPVGAAPFGVAADPTDGRVYVADNGAQAADGTGRVSVVDPSTGATTTLVTTTVAGLVAVDAAARRLYASNANASGTIVSLDVFDLTSASRIASLPVGGHGVALDTTRSRAYVAGGRTLTAVDTTTFATTTTFAPSGESWFGVATDSGLGRVYVTNIGFGRPSLVVLDAASLAVLDDIALPVSPRFALAVDAVAHVVYLAGSDLAGPPFANSAVFALDGASGTILRSSSLPGFPGGLIRFAASHRLYVTEMDRSTLVELDETTLAPTSPALALPWSPALLDLASDARIYVAGNSANVLGAVAQHVNTAPVIDSLSLSPASPRTNDVVTASVAAHDPDGDVLTYTYAWQRNGVTIAGATGPSLDLSVAGNGDKGDTITVRVTVSDGQATTNATASVTVANTPPTVTVSLSTATPGKRDTVVATATGADADSDALIYSYTWRLGGVLQPNTTSSFDLRKVEAEYGTVLTVTVVASDGTVQASASASATVTRPSH
ncbi:MAG TPA: hypothetical protein VEU77_04240 [Candidatus Acidoferrales bacterium]|nr:hypothetical protein [Candidatus Acidoferrales bacterium]